VSGLYDSSPKHGQLKEVNPFVHWTWCTSKRQSSPSHLWFPSSTQRLSYLMSKLLSRPQNTCISQSLYGFCCPFLASSKWLPWVDALCFVELFCWWVDGFNNGLDSIEIGYWDGTDLRSANESGRSFRDFRTLVAKTHAISNVPSHLEYVSIAFGFRFNEDCLVVARSTDTFDQVNGVRHNKE